MLWNLKDLNSSKWEAIWKQVFARATHLGLQFYAAEQTLLNYVAFEHPTIIFEIPCYWHIQFWDSCLPEMCRTTWNFIGNEGIPAPHLLHFDVPNKREEFFDLHPITKQLRTIEEFRHNYLVERSRIIQIDGYTFGEPKQVFNFNEILLRIHPEDRNINNNLTNSDWPYPGAFPLRHRIHPSYFYRSSKPLKQDNSAVTLVHAIHYNRYAIKQLEALSNSWPGFTSVVIHATDLEAHDLLRHLLNSTKLTQTNIHLIYKKAEAEVISSAMHNIAIVFAQTSMILKAKVSNPAHVSALFEVVSKNLFLKPAIDEMKIFLNWKFISKVQSELLLQRCADDVLYFCVLTIKRNENLNFTVPLKNATVGVLLSRAYGLLPDTNAILSEDDEIAALITNFISPYRITP